MTVSKAAAEKVTGLGTDVSEVRVAQPMARNTVFGLLLASLLFVGLVVFLCVMDYVYGNDLAKRVLIVLAVLHNGGGYLLLAMRRTYRNMLAGKEFIESVTIPSLSDFLKEMYPSGKGLRSSSTPILASMGFAIVLICGLSCLVVSDAELVGRRVWLVNGKMVPSGSFAVAVPFWDHIVSVKINHRTQNDRYYATDKDGDVFSVRVTAMHRLELTEEKLRALSKEHGVGDITDSFHKDLDALWSRLLREEARQIKLTEDSEYDAAVLQSQLLQRGVSDDELSRLGLEWRGCRYAQLSSLQYHQ